MKASERERFCEAGFRSEGQYWHAFTSGKDTAMIFAAEDDFRFAMNVVALAAGQHPGLKILAFEVMDNHFHFVVSGTEADVRSFWDFIFRKLSRQYPALKNTHLGIKAIEDLRSLRNHIVYVHRNGYVANPGYTPFSYPWGSGRYYFMDWTDTAMDSLRYRELRGMFHCRTPEVQKEWRIVNGFISPPSYCAIKFGMSIFRDAQHYFSLVSKNMESYAELATELNDSEFLTDMEVFAQLSRILSSEYGTDRVRNLSQAQKLDLARRLRRDFRSSNEQIRRVLGLSRYDINTLFPLSSKPE